MKRILFALLTSLALSGSAHAVWDASTPTGSESRSLGDDRIREFKTDVQTALEHQGAFPGADTSNPRYINTPSSGTTASRPTGNDRVHGMFYVNTSSKNVEQYDAVSGQWVGVGTFFPSGTKMPFFQASCPDGWTKDTTASYEDRTVRITTGTGGGTGGTNAMSTGLAHTHTSATHNHSIPEASIEHTHLTSVIENNALNLAVRGNINGLSSSSLPDGQAIHTFAGTGTTAAIAGWNYLKTDPVDDYANGNTGSTAVTTDSTSPTFKYMDMLICTKN